MLYNPDDLPDQRIDPPREEELTDEERQDERETAGDADYHFWREQ
jgi:hypothetical protein